MTDDFEPATEAEVIALRVRMKTETHLLLLKRKDSIKLIEHRPGTESETPSLSTADCCDWLLAAFESQIKQLITEDNEPLWRDYVQYHCDALWEILKKKGR